MPENYKPENNRWDGYRRCITCTIGRKTKCDRRLPCSNCIARNIADLCHYPDELNPKQDGNIHTMSDPPQTIGASPAPAPAPQAPIANPTVPLTSLQDNGLSKRPRDARLIHMLLSSLGVTAYQERVPLQVLDFAYRHTSSILTDALHLSSDAYVSQQTRAKDAPAGGIGAADGQVSPNAVQLAIQSRLQYQFGGSNTLSKDTLLEMAQKRNKVALPRVLQNEWGVRLPSERYVLTGAPWGLKSETEDDTQQQESMEGVETTAAPAGEEEDINEEGGTMDDLFGTGEDHEMMDGEA